MRIVFVPADTGGCMYHRCWVPGQHLRSLGHQVHFARAMTDREFDIADVVVFQRQISADVLELLGRIRARGGVVFHEFDDNFHEVPPANPHAVYYNDNPSTRALERFCEQADGLIVSTPDLAVEYHRFNRRVFVCYNALDDRQFARIAPSEITCGTRRLGQVRIGYAGGGSHSGDFEMIAPAITLVLRRFPEARLVFIGASYRQHLPEELWDQTEFLGGTGSGDTPYDDPRLDGVTERGLASVGYYNMVAAAQFDIGIAPIEPVTFNRCKSYLKPMEYGAFGTASVVSRFGPYLQYQAEAGEPVVALAQTVDEWRVELERLVASAEWRVRLASANLRYVRRAHLMSKRVEAWVDAFEATINENVWRAQR
jgi:O-antigen biosynthesis protein